MHARSNMRRMSNMYVTTLPKSRTIDHNCEIRESIFRIAAEARFLAAPAVEEATLARERAALEGAGSRALEPGGRCGCAMPSEDFWRVFALNASERLTARHAAFEV